MPYTGTDVANEARSAHLNDSAGTLFTNAVLLPIIRKCYEDAQRRCTREGIPVTAEVTSPPIAVPANQDFITLPADLLVPVWIGRRPSGSTSTFTPMHEELWEPEDQPQSILTKWVWRDETVFVLPSTTAEEAKIRYRRTFPVLAAIGDTILISDLQNYLAAKVAATVAANIGENPERASIIADHAESLWDDFLTIATKKRQNTPVRRRPMRRPRMRIT